MKRKFYFIAAIFLAAFTADSFAQLTKIWDRSSNNFALEGLCRPGKLAVLSLSGVNQYLIDLTNGEIIFSTQYPEIVNFNYWGDHYYVHNINENVIREYEVHTKNLIGEVNCIPYYGDSTSSRYNSEDKILYFVKYGSNEHLDSVRISTLFQAHSFSIDKSSFDGRYLSLFIYNMSPKYQLQHTQTLIYDKKKKEIVNSLPTKNDLLMQFFNNSNLMAYAENIKLPKDDKAYSYIRIFDPDKREVVKNIKISNVENGVFYFLLSQNDSYLIYLTAPSNVTKFFDLVNEKKIDFEISTEPGPIYLDESLYVTSYFTGYTFDWNAVGVEDEPNPNIPVIYPNPSTNTVNLIVDEKYFHGQWRITDLSGRVILNGIILPEPQLQINIGHLPAQTYYLRLQKESFTVTYPLIKN